MSDAGVRMSAVSSYPGSLVTCDLMGSLVVEPSLQFAPVATGEMGTLPSAASPPPNTTSNNTNNNEYTSVRIADCFGRVDVNDPSEIISNNMPSSSSSPIDAVSNLPIGVRNLSTSPSSPFVDSPKNPPVVSPLVNLFITHRSSLNFADMMVILQHPSASSFERQLANAYLQICSEYHVSRSKEHLAKVNSGMHDLLRYYFHKHALFNEPFFKLLLSHMTAGLFLRTSYRLLLPSTTLQVPVRRSLWQMSLYSSVLVMQT